MLTVFISSGRSSDDAEISGLSGISMLDNVGLILKQDCEIIL